MNKGLRKEIHRKYDTIKVNECLTSKTCCMFELENHRDKKGRKIHRLLAYRGEGCVSSQNKKAVFKTRDRQHPKSNKGVVRTKGKTRRV